MATRQQPKPAVDWGDEDSPATGRYIDTETRSVQHLGGRGKNLGCNLSDKGVAQLGVTGEDTVDLVIFANGIWIPRK